MAKKMLFLFVLLLSLTGMLKAQVTTAGMSGKVMADEESVIGATVVAVHEPSGTSYGTVTNVDLDVSVCKVCAPVVLTR